MYPLEIAVKKGHVEAVRLLLSSGAKVDFKNDCNRTILSQICEAEYADLYPNTTETAKLLLEYGADPNLTENFISHDREIHKLLLKYGKTNYLYDMLLESAGNGDIELVGMILDTDEVYANSKDEDINLTALGCAGNDEEMVKYLLSKGADPNQSSGNYDAYPLTAFSGDLEMTRLLVEQYDADPNNQEFEGHCCACHCSFEVLEYLIDRLNDSCMDCVLSCTSNRRDIEKINLLIKNGVINSQKRLLTAMAAAIGKGCLDMIKVLFDCADRNKIEYQNFCFLSKASFYGHVDIVKYFLDNGFKYNLGHALSKAIKGKNLKVIELLSNVGDETNLGVGS